MFATEMGLLPLCHALLAIQDQDVRLADRQIHVLTLPVLRRPRLSYRPPFFAASAFACEINKVDRDF